MLKFTVKTTHKNGTPKTIIPHCSCCGRPMNFSILYNYLPAVYEPECDSCERENISDKVMKKIIGDMEDSIGVNC